MPNSGCEYYNPVEGGCGRTCAPNSTYCNSYECAKEGCHEQKTKDCYGINLEPYCVARKCFYICAHKHRSLSLRCLRYRFGGSVCRVDLAKLNSWMLRDSRMQALMDLRGVGNQERTLILDGKRVTDEGAVMSAGQLYTYRKLSSSQQKHRVKSPPSFSARDTKTITKASSTYKKQMCMHPKRNQLQSQ
ncbi:hypothetical protein CISG_10207 [Coccidioides immitis RMSCC 3703]|uniref:Uncharacterized protein n=1 Tax=Coccidioides immitis RMSCC 3703 TaxID=454286 RepID=A0A0J8TIR7_COCIT|nr:hypothetical protein CISG_10207 [Coccidioides immitis RMSCC 3703]